jgi:PAS domain S-box-containing protein
MTNGGDQRERKGASIPEAEDLLVLAQEAGNFGIFEWWVQTGAVKLSPMLQRLFGVRDFEGPYETWRGFVFREDLVRLEHSIDEALAAHVEGMTIEFRIVKQDDGTIRWLERRSVIFYGADGRPERLVGISVDVTERKRATAQLHALAETLEERVRERTRELEEENKARVQAEETLRQAQKMEAVGQLTGGVAHDFNNLLTIIMGGLELIGRQMPLLPAPSSVQRIGRARDMAVKGAERAALLTQTLLAFSRQQPLSPQAVDANKLVSGVSDLLQRTIGEAVSLETALADELWLSHADPNQLENALVNLAVQCARRDA